MPEAKDHKIVIAVIDSGVGLKVEEQTKLFRLYGTIKRTKSLNTKGVGLGLSISKMISQEFGGDVGVKSKVGVGAAFVSSMMLNASKSEKKKSEEEAILAAKLNEAVSRQLEQAMRNYKLLYLSKNHSNQTSKILIVDDEAYNCEVLKMMIISLGFPPSNLTLSMSGKDALALVKESMNHYRWRYSLILTDLSMPLMDGYKFIRKVRAAYS